MGQVPEVRFAPARRGRIAYQDFGSGDEVMVAIPPMAQNVEVSWERPEIRAMLERFASFCRFIPFDKRGTGSSDRSILVPNIDERVDDLRAVMDHAGVDRAHLFAQSEGGPMTLLFAASYPERVEGIILHGTGAWTSPQDLEGAEREHVLERLAYSSSIWGTPESPWAQHFAPSMADVPGYHEWHRRYERLAADQDSLLELMEISLDVDVTDVLADIDVPVLVLHRVDDPVVSIDWARFAADRLPNSTMVELPGRDHFAYSGDQVWLDDLEHWLTGSVTAPDALPRQPRAPRITTLGRFAVEVVGEEVPTSAWVSRRARQLLKRLAAAHGWPVTRDELCEMLWPDEPDPSRLGSRLSVQLSGVRKVLGRGVVADRQTVALDLDDVAIDLVEFHRASDDDAIIEAYTGVFLPEDVYDDWTGPIRDEARARFVSAARRTAVAATERGDTDRAAELARRLIDADRYDEDAHRLLVEALLLAGERREAQRAHATWSSTLDEIGVEVVPFDDLAG